MFCFLYVWISDLYRIEKYFLLNVLYKHVQNVIFLSQPVGNVALSESSQQLVLDLPDSICGPRGLPRLSGRYHLLLHVADLPASSGGQHGGQGAI